MSTIEDLIYVNNRKHLARKYINSWDKKTSRAVCFGVATRKFWEDVDNRNIKNIILIYFLNKKNLKNNYYYNIKNYSFFTWVLSLATP